MNVSKKFLRDFAFLANYYGWTPTEVEDVRGVTRGNPELMLYWSTLANALRAGYQQTPENGYIRLDAWCRQHGQPVLYAPRGSV
jgi:hypothetical protein